MGKSDYIIRNIKEKELLMRDEIMQELYKTFKLSTRQGSGGMTFKYVPNEAVINRMNEVFKGNWSTVIKHKDIIDDQVIVEVEVSVLDPDDGVRQHSHTGFGSQQIMRYNSGQNKGKIIDIGNAYKSALAKSIVNACTRWGVGLYKESNPYGVEDEVETPTMTVEIPAIPTQLPPVSTPTPMPAVQPPAVDTTATPPPSPYTIETTAAPVVIPPPPTAVEVPTMVEAPPVVLPEPSTIETITTFTPPLVPEQPVSAHISVVQEAQPEMPKIPAPIVNTVPPQAPEIPFSDDGGLGSIGISDVQKVALNGILTMNNAEYAPLAKEAFEASGINKAIPNRENLNYEEAVVVIKFGNEKYRKTR